jgi:hypothetical protein
MKRTVVLWILVGMLSSSMLAQTSGDKSAGARDKETLLKLTDDITTAKIKRDTATLDRLLASEYILTNPAGFVANKSEYLDGARADTATYESVTNYDLVVSLYGDAAVAVGGTTVKGRYDGHEIGGQFRFTHVFVKREDRWQAVATQLTRVARQ